jgi:hypothetical protein
MLKKVLIGTAGALLLACVVSLFIPSRYTVERSVVIERGASEIYPYVNHLKKWQEWTPWTREKYPTMEYSYAGPEEGVGAVSVWKEESGNGKLTITRSDSVTGIEYDLEFDNGEMKSRGMIRFESVGQGTRVLWRNTGDVGMNPIGKYFTLFLDGMMGPDFESGLGKLKTLVEQR